MDYIVDKYSLDNFKISKPKQVKNKYVSKVTIDSEELIVQFPKMVINDITVDSLTLEFDNNSSSYSQKCYNFLGKLDSLILQHIYSNSPEWFGKQIPMDSIKNMYNSFLKAPKNVDSSVNITLAVTKKSLFFNYKNKSMDFSDINNTYSCAVIAKLKYIIFSRDNAYSIWELLSAKNYKKINKVKEYGFIDDPEDSVSNEESLEYDNTAIIESNNFF